MPLPPDIDLRAERMDGRSDSDWIVTGMVGGQRIEVARVPYKGPAYDHAALAVLMAASKIMLVALQDIAAGFERTDISHQDFRVRAAQIATAAIQSATTIPTTDEGGR